MNINKLVSSAKKLDTFFKVLQKIVVISMSVVLCIMVVLTVVNAVNPDAVIGEGLNSIDLGSVTIELAEEYTPNNRTILGYAWVYVVLALICAGVMYISFDYIRKILKPMTEGSPFHSDTARYLKKLAVLSLVLGIAQNIGSVIETISALHSFGLNTIMESGMISSITANYSFDLSFIVIFFVLMLMSYIFSYGAQLQQLSDETL